MPNILVLYASTHGQTRKIAQRIGADLEAAGADVTLTEAGGADVPSLDTYDVVVIGASIHAGHHQHDVVDWARHHAMRLSRAPSALFSVSLSAAEDTDEGRTTTQRYVDDLLDDTGWNPTLKTSFAGALQYREYDFFTRMMMRLLMARGHHPTDTSRDTDYTDWDAVDAFADRVIGLVPAAAAL
ncbi:MAG: menaquinone-dependent protoporphyrinogen oxidase [Solirubrobacteraceae bacterium]|jgi:menaquinone-dependent protoporphyrinogen oxidase|nr:menaquinone-dependent protoporphyrinogen oxidase [Solirubrobacteraceae bacterium]